MIVWVIVASTASSASLLQKKMFHKQKCVNICLYYMEATIKMPWMFNNFSFINKEGNIIHLNGIDVPSRMLSAMHEKWALFKSISSKHEKCANGDAVMTVHQWLQWWGSVLLFPWGYQYCIMHSAGLNETAVTINKHDTCALITWVMRMNGFSCFKYAIFWAQYMQYKWNLR